MVPIVGEIRSGISFLEAVGRSIALIDETGNVALDIYDIANDEDNALQAIFGIVLSLLAIFLRMQLLLAELLMSAGMSADNVAELGEGLSDRVSKIRQHQGRMLS